jgi:hypothetical protein
MHLLEVVDALVYNCVLYRPGTSATVGPSSGKGAQSGGELVSPSRLRQGCRKRI